MPGESGGGGTIPIEEFLRLNSDLIAAKGQVYEQKEALAKASAREAALQNDVASLRKIVAQSEAQLRDAKRVADEAHASEQTAKNDYKVLKKRFDDRVKEEVEKAVTATAGGTVSSTAASGPPSFESGSGISSAGKSIKSFFSFGSSSSSSVPPPAAAAAVGNGAAAPPPPPPPQPGPAGSSSNGAASLSPQPRLPFSEGEIEKAVAGGDVDDAVSVLASLGRTREIEALRARGSEESLSLELKREQARREAVEEDLKRVIFKLSEGQQRVLEIRQELEQAQASRAALAEQVRQLKSAAASAPAAGSASTQPQALQQLATSAPAVALRDAAAAISSVFGGITSSGDSAVPGSGRRASIASIFGGASNSGTQPPPPSVAAAAAASAAAAVAAAVTGLRPVGGSPSLAPAASATEAAIPSADIDSDVVVVSVDVYGLDNVLSSTSALAASTAEVGDLKAQVTMMEALRDKLLAAVQKKDQLFSEAQQESERLVEAVRARDQELLQLRPLSEELAQMSTQLRRKEEEVAKMKADASLAITLQAQVKAQSKTIETMTGAVAQQQLSAQRLAELETMTRAQAIEAEQLRSDVQRVERRETEIKERLYTSEQLAIDLQGDLEQAKHTMAHLEANTHALEDELAAHQRDAEDLLKECEVDHARKTAEQEERRMTECQHLAKQIEVLSARTEKLAVEAETMRSQADRLHTELSSLRDAHDKATADLTAKTTRLAEAEDQLFEQAATEKAQERLQGNIILELKQQLRKEATAREDLRIQLKLLRSDAGADILANHGMSEPASPRLGVFGAEGEGERTSQISAVTGSAGAVAALKKQNEVLTAKVRFLEDNTRMLLDDLEEKRHVIASLARDTRLATPVSPISMAQGMGSPSMVSASGQRSLGSAVFSPTLPHPPGPVRPMVGPPASAPRGSNAQQHQHIATLAEDAAAVARLQSLLQEQVGNNVRLRKDLGMLGDEVGTLMKELTAVKKERDALQAGGAAQLPQSTALVSTTTESSLAARAPLPLETSEPTASASRGDASQATSASTGGQPVQGLRQPPPSTMSSGSSATSMAALSTRSEATSGSTPWTAAITAGDGAGGAPAAAVKPVALFPAGPEVTAATAPPQASTQAPQGTPEEEGGPRHSRTTSVISTAFWRESRLASRNVPDDHDALNETAAAADARVRSKEELMAALALPDDDDRDNPFANDGMP